MMWDEDDDSWLMPSKDASTQSEKFDINAYLSDLKLSDSASTLSKKIAKAQMRRVQKQNKLGQIEEKEEKSTPPPPSTGSQEDMGASLSVAGPLHASFGPAPKLLTQYSSPCNTNTARLTSTPVAARTQLAFDLVSPINSNPNEVFESSYDDEDEFEDAPDHFGEEAMERISMSASFSTIEAILAKNDLDDGQSCIRSPMTQSLVKVEEEELPRLDLSNRSTRSASVSPRPLISTTATAPRNPIVLQQTPVSAEKKPVAKTPPKPAAQQLTETPRSALGSSHQETPLSVRTALNLHSDLATLDDLTRRQEEMLRQEVLQQQQQAERKNSWQGETGSLSSPNSSVGSLASSQSVDIGVLKKTLPNSATPSRLRAPSKLPRPSGLVAPSPRVSSVAGVRAAASLEKSRSVVDDECF